MNEPLTKDKIIHGLRNDYVDIKNIKSALEEFENNMLRLAEEAPKLSTKAACELSIHIMKKAFPAIYEKEDLRTTIVDPFPRRPKQ